MNSFGAAHFAASRSIRLFALVLLCAAHAAATNATPLSAQATAAATTCPPVTGPPFLPCQVDVPATLPPNFQLALSAFDGVERRMADVRVRFVSDTNGRVRSATIVPGSAHDARYGQWVLNALPRTRFVSAIRNNKRVPMLHDELITLVLPPQGLHALPPMPPRRETQPNGMMRMVFGQPLPDSAGASTLTQADLLAAQALAVQGRVMEQRRHGSDSPAVVTACVTLRTASAAHIPDAATLRAMSTSRIRAVVPSECPRTYASMVRTPGDPVRPAGYIDPYRVAVTSVKPWSAEQVYVEFDIHHGMGVRRELCGVRRTAGQWVAYCTTTVAIVH